jgi:hypothetical protein
MRRPEGLTDPDCVSFKRRALQSIRIRCSPPRVTVAMASSSGIGCSFRVSGSPKYRSAWSGEPAVPSALASAVRVFLGELRWSHF